MDVRGQMACRRAVVFVLYVFVLHCPSVTVQVFLETISDYRIPGKNRMIDLGPKVKNLIPKISESCKRYEEEG